MMNSILYAAFKYALGRTSYCVFDLTRILKKYGGHLTEGTLSQMVTDINTAEKEDCLGHDCDVKDWLGVRDFLLSPLVKNHLGEEFEQDDLDSLFIYSMRYFLKVNEVNEDMAAFARAYKFSISAHLRVLLLREISDHMTLRGHAEWMSVLREIQS